MSSPATSAAQDNPGAGVRRFQPSFFIWMTLVMAVFIFGGFGMTYLFPLARGSLAPAPPVVHLHGLVLFSWTILLVMQPLLANRGSMALHRSVGTFGIALATAVIFMGAIITLLGAAATRDSPGPNYYHGIYLGIMAVTGFALQFTLAIRNVRRPEIHKRMMLLAMLPIMPPGIHRFYMVPFGMTSFPIVPMYITLDLMAAAIILHEWKRTGRVGAHTLAGTAWILAQQALHHPVTHSEWFAGFLYALTEMVRYR